MANLIAEAGDDRSDANRYDARSALLVRYLWADPDRKARLATYLDRLEAGDRDPEGRLGRGVRPAGRDTGAGATVLPARTARPGDPRQADGAAARDQNPPDAGGCDDLILELQRLKSNPYVDRASLLRRLRKAAARRPDERYSRQALARAEDHHRRPRQGRAPAGGPAVGRRGQSGGSAPDGDQQAVSGRRRQGARRPAAGLGPSVPGPRRRGRAERLPDPVPAGPDHGGRREAVAGTVGPTAAGGDPGASRWPRSGS